MAARRAVPEWVTPSEAAAMLRRRHILVSARTIQRKALAGHLLLREPPGWRCWHLIHFPTLLEAMKCLRHRG